MSTQPLTAEHENAILKNALFGQFGIVSGLNLIEACLAKATKAVHGDAPFGLDHDEAKLWHRAQQEAYRHVLEMVTVDPATRPLEHSMPVNFASQIHDGPVRAGDVFRLPNGEAITALEQMPGGVMLVRIQGKSIRTGDRHNYELKGLPRIGRAEYLDGTYITPDWMYADFARARIRDLTQQLEGIRLHGPAAEFPDWRVVDGCADEISPAAAGNGKLSITEEGYGAALVGITPSGREFRMHFEFDADTPKFTIYPPNCETGLPLDEEPVVHAAVLDDAVIISTGRGPFATLYQPQGTEPCPHFNGEEAMQRTRHPLYGLYKAVVLEEFGYEFREDSDQPGKWLWTTPTDICETSFESAKAAVENAWEDAKQQALAIKGAGEEEWLAMTSGARIEFLREALAADESAPAPR